jgi:hypothetical protein
MARVAASLVVAASTGVVDQYSAHHARGYGEKMGAVLPADGFLINEPDVGLVD